MEKNNTQLSASTKEDSKKTRLVKMKKVKPRTKDTESSWDRQLTEYQMDLLCEYQIILSKM